MRVYVSRLIMLVMLCSCTSAFAQEAELGTIEELDQDNGSITISGRVLPFSDFTTEVYVGERRIGPERIDQGMVVRYTLDESGTLRRIDLIGPNDMLQELDRH